MVLDWEVVVQTGLGPQLELLSRQEWTQGSYVEFICTTWWRIFHVNEPTASPHADIISFRLDGIDRQCSLMEFVEQIGLYPAQVATSSEYHDFISHCSREFPSEFEPTTFWATIREGYYSPQDRFEGHI